jgi:hypothetical protein
MRAHARAHTKERRRNESKLLLRQTVLTQTVSRARTRPHHDISYASCATAAAKNSDRHVAPNMCAYSFDCFLEYGGGTLFVAMRMVQGGGAQACRSVVTMRVCARKRESDRINLVAHTQCRSVRCACGFESTPCKQSVRARRCSLLPNFTIGCRRTTTTTRTTTTARGWGGPMCCRRRCRRQWRANDSVVGWLWW